jgi:hypothetical protein
MEKIGVNVNETFTEKQKIEAAYALNLCTVSLAQIVDYADPYVLEQEYDSILNNLNIQNIIHDEALLKLIKKIMETLTFYRIQEGDKKYLEQEYQGKMKNAIWSAVPSLSVILAGGNPITAAAAVATQIGIGYMNYRKTKSMESREKEKKEWELKRTLIEEISGLQRELFETAWRLSDRYSFNDNYRLTEKQIKAYSAILKDSDPLRRYERLDTQNEIFQAFPPFWYYKGNAAQEIARKYAKNPDIAEKYRAKALENYRKFDSIYIELMREDVIAASCAMEHIALLDKTKDKDEIEGLLGRAIHLAGDNFDVLQLAVLNWLSLSKNDQAKAVLRRLVNEDYNIGLNGLLLSRIYCKWDKDKAEFSILQDRIGRQNVIPWVEDDSEADKKYIEGREEAVSLYLENFLDAFGRKYQNYFNNLIGYDKSLRLRNQVDWCLGVDITQALVDTSNEMFRELLRNELFVLQKRPENKPWDDFFISQSAGLSERIQKFNLTQIKIKNEIIEIMEKKPFGIIENMGVIGDSANKATESAGKAFDSLNKTMDGKLGFLKTGASTLGNIAGKAVESAGRALEEKTNIVQSISGNKAEQEKLKNSVKALLQACYFLEYSNDFFAAVKTEFKKSLTVESLVSLQENMILVINKWYRENGFEIQESIIDGLEVDKPLFAPQNDFFIYPD